jgi:Beta-propeller repeat
MFNALTSCRRRFDSRAYSGISVQRKISRTRRLELESLEPRQVLSGTTMTFQVLNDATTNLSYQYSDAGAPQGSTTLAAANAAPRGAASTVGIEKTWVIDANRSVYVYNTSGGLLGSWSAGSMPANATPEGIATDGTDIWIVDSKGDKTYRYTGAASRVSGSQNAASSFSLAYGNANPKDMVTDGASLWVVDDTAKTDRVFKYSVTTGYVGNWTIDTANKTPTGIALDPANVGDMWISDSGTDRVYKYPAATSRSSGNQSAASNFALTAGNGNAQGLVVPGRPWAEAPYEVEWVRQFGTTADDWIRGVTTDGSGNIYVSGSTNGSLTVPNPTGVFTPYLTRFDRDGNQPWVNQDDPIAGVDYGGVRVATDSSGNVFQVVNVTFGSAASALNSYGANGNLWWSTPLPVGESMFDVTVDAVGFAYTSSYEGNFVHVRKFDGATGNVVWQSDFDTGGTTNSSGISADQMGSIYVTAYTSGSLLGPNAGSYDALVIKLSEAGQVMWTRQYGSPDIDLAFYAAADAFGNVYSGGRTRGSLGGPSAGAVDFFLAKHDGTGNLLWTRQYGTSGEDTQADMWVDPDGNIYRSIATTGSLAGPYLGGWDVVVAKYDPLGNIQWATQLGTSGDDRPEGGITGDAQGNLYVAVRTSGALGGPNAGSNDDVLIKLSPPPGSKSGGSFHSLEAGASQTDSANSLSSLAVIGTASTSILSTPSMTTGRAGNKFSALPQNNMVAERSTPNTLRTFPAREQVFASLTRDRDYTPARRASRATTAGSLNDEELADYVSRTGAMSDDVLDTVVARLTG